ncbi:MAG: DMT family transporter [Desulfovibrionaceae bacterium]
MNTASPILPAVGLVLAMLIWASSFIAMKVAVMAFDPMLAICARMVIAALCFACLAPRLRGMAYRKGDWRYMAFMAFCEPCLYFVCEGYALRLTSASQAGMVSATLPVMVAVGAWFVLREKLGPRAWLGLALAVAGVAWLSLSGEATEAAPNPLAGNLLEFLAMVAATGYMLTLKKLTSRYSPLFLTAVQAVGGSIFFLPVVAATGGFAAPLPDPLPLGPALAVLYLGTAVTLGAYGLYNFGVSRLEAGKAAAYINLIPVLAVLMGWLFLDETLTPPQYAASALVLAGVLLSQGGGKRTAGA